MIKIEGFCSLGMGDYYETYLRVTDDKLDVSAGDRWSTTSMTATKEELRKSKIKSFKRCIDKLVDKLPVT